MSNIYFHYPFCKQACNYCNFHFSTSKSGQNSLWDAMNKELLLRKDEIKVPIESVYFGGGSPSLISPKKIDKLLNYIHDNFIINSQLEVTLEVNPDDVSLQYLDALKQAGINRISLGIQSFHQKDLSIMNRAHNNTQALSALKCVAQKFSNFTLDLIYGIPNSTLKEWKENLNLALEFDPPHLSVYALTVEEKTALDFQVKKGEITLISEEAVKKQYDFLTTKMRSLKYINYEFSNFGKEGYFSVNNQNYWNGKFYIGIGPSAHSYDGFATRSWNVSNNHKYVAAIKKEVPLVEVEHLTTKDRYNEYIMTGLRKVEGISLDYVKKIFGSSYGTYLESQVGMHLEARNFYWDGNYLKITPKAKFLSDGLAADLFRI